MKGFVGGASLAAVLLAGTVLPSTAATTATYAPGTSKGIDFDLDSFRDKITKAGGFTDYFTFTVPSKGEFVSASLTSTFASLDVSAFNIYSGKSGSTLTSFMPNTIAVAGTVAKSGSTTSGAIPTAAALVPGAMAFLSAGLYAVTVTGTGTGAFTGTFNTMAVPLPTTVAMFGIALAGLGVAGAVRRKGSASATA